MTSPGESFCLRLSVSVVGYKVLKGTQSFISKSSTSKGFMKIHLTVNKKSTTVDRCFWRSQGDL